MSVVRRDPALHARLTDLARATRMVVVAGLPGTGKSLVIHELAQLASAAERRVHLLQWDVARPVFEATPAGQRYPVVDGVTQPMIRAAVGRWARGAIAGWHRRHAIPGHGGARGGDLLIVEAPFVGGRLIELARPIDDDAEPFLASASCVFVLPVPSTTVRAHIERERERRASAPNHPREREDAPPALLRALWAHLVDVARALGIVGDTGGAARDTYDPAVYRRVYEMVLRHRAVEALPLDVVLPTAAMSVYDLAAACVDLVPTAEEADALVRETEARTSDPAVLARAVERWWLV